MSGLVVTWRGFINNYLSIVFLPTDQHTMSNLYFLTGTKQNTDITESLPGDINHSRYTAREVSSEDLEIISPLHFGFHAELCDREIPIFLL